MNEKEKAQELVDKYQNLLYINVTDLDPVYQYEAKQCAKIAVDEILLNTMDGYHHEEYWQEVKKQIEAL